MAKSSLEKGVKRFLGVDFNSGLKRKKAKNQDFYNSSGDSGALGTVWLAALLIVILWFFAASTVLYRYSSIPPDLVVGQTMDKTIYSEVEFDHVDYEATNRRRQAVIEQVPLVFKVNTELNREQIGIIEALADYYQRQVEMMQTETETERESETSDSVSVETSLRSELNERLPVGLPEILERTAPPRQIHEFLDNSNHRDELLKILRNRLRQGVRPENIEDLFLEKSGPRDQIKIIKHGSVGGEILIPTSQISIPEESARKALNDFVEEADSLTDDQKEIASIIIDFIVEPNLYFHSTRTKEEKEEAAAEVDNVIRTVAAGEILVQRGEKLTAEDLEKIRIYYRQVEENRPAKSLPAAELYVIPLLVFLLVLGYGRGLLLFDHKAVSTHNRLLLIVVIACLQLIASRGVILLFYLHDISSFYLLAGLPVALGAVLIAQLISLPAAIWTTIFTALITSLQTGNSLAFFVVGSIAGVVAALLVYRARRRIEMFRAGLWLGLAFFVGAALFYLDRGIPLEAFGLLAIIALLNGLGTAVLASTIMPIFEYFFGVITDISLLEMSDLNHPLLRKLQIEAPGTFHHSLMVAILAEQAAAAINANPLLARVCAYFHDIGKISQAEYFVENSFASEEDDAHSQLQPRMSSLIILNHVKEGLALAGEHKLNNTLREAIAQHHGTSLIYFFYRRAEEQQKQSPRNTSAPKQHEFRYPGPLPTRKEVVLIGLADACEAAARSLQKTTPQKLKARVGEIISQKLHDGQFDQADLTFSELAIVRDTMVKTLSTMYHGRISYQNEEQEGRGKEGDKGASDINKKSKKTENSQSGAGWTSGDSSKLSGSTDK